MKSPKFYAFHSMTHHFPFLHGEEMEDLIQDIRTNGLRHPIVLFENEILDGRNRYLACDQAGVTPRYECFSGTRQEAFRYMVSCNLHRRHLNESQRAMIAAELVKAAEEEGTRLSKSEAADLMNVSRSSLYSAKHVREKGTPSLIAEVQAGNLSVAMAEKIAAQPRRVQQRIVTLAEKASMMVRLREIQTEISPGHRKVERPVWSEEAPDESGLYWMKCGDGKAEIVEYCAEHRKIKAVYTTLWDGVMAIRSLRKKTLWCRIYEPVMEGART